MSDIAADISFGAAGNAAPFQIYGFSTPEDSHIWTDGGKAALRVPLAPGSCPTLLELDVAPFVREHCSHQTLVLRIDGVTVAADRIACEGRVGYWLPEHAGHGSAVLIEMILPDAASPQDAGLNDDPRRLGFRLTRARLLDIPRDVAFRPRRLPPLWDDYPPATELLPALEAEVFRRCGLSVHDLMYEFESLGWNCEFGILQRRCGAEPLSLLRFMGISLPSLLEALAQDFAGIDDPAHTRLDVVGDGQEFILHNDVYDLSGHTWRSQILEDHDKVLRDVLRNMRFYTRKFREDLEGGSRLFVFQRQLQMLPAHAVPLLTALRRHGDCALLIICEDTGLPSGTVEQLGPHLFRASIGALAPSADVAQSDLPAWLSICTNAWCLWKDRLDACPEVVWEAGAGGGSGIRCWLRAFIHRRTGSLRRRAAAGGSERLPARTGHAGR